MMQLRNYGVSMMKTANIQLGHSQQFIKMEEIGGRRGPGVTPRMLLGPRPSDSGKTFFRRSFLVFETPEQSYTALL